MRHPFAQHTTACANPQVATAPIGDARCCPRSPPSTSVRAAQLVKTAMETWHREPHEQTCSGAGHAERPAQTTRPRRHSPVMCHAAAGHDQHRRTICDHRCRQRGKLGSQTTSPSSSVSRARMRNGVSPSGNFRAYPSTMQSSSSAVILMTSCNNNLCVSSGPWRIHDHRNPRH